MYRGLIERKHSFSQRHTKAYNEQHFNLSLEGFLRELFLEASDCENTSFMRPQLMRESFSAKGSLYRTEKIIVKSYMNCFPFTAGSRIKDSILTSFDLL